MKLFEGIVHRGVLTAVAALIVCILGIVAAQRIPVQMIPDLDVRTITVRTHWAGATPQDVEKEILIEQEDALRSLPNLSRLTATANSGRADIELEFPFGTDVTQMLIRVNNALSQVPSYPENVDEPRIYATSFSANSFMFFYVAPQPGNPRQLDMDLARDFVKDNIQTAMSRVQGVSEIGVWGGADRQIQIHIDPAKLARLGLSLNDVRNRLRERNRDRSGGEIESGKRRYLLRTVGRFEDIAALESLIIKRDGNALVKLKDVASVRLDHFKKTDIAFVNGDPILFLTVRREAGSNVIDIKREMLAKVAEVNRDIAEPAGLIVRHLADDVVYVDKSIKNVWQNLGLGAVLATLVMLLFLRSVKATVIGVMGIPICTIAAFLGLLLAGRTINVISLAGVAFAIGMTLDNSIVVLESIELERRRGKNRFQAAIDGVAAVWPAVLASTLTTILVFLPVAFIQQEAGQLYGDIAIAISAAILASMLVAITIVPTAAARVTGADLSGEQHTAPVIRQALLSTVSSVIATPARRIGLIVASVALSAGIFIFLTPPAEYLPEGEEPKIFAVMNAPTGYNLETMARITLDVQEQLLPHVNADPADFQSGKSSIPAMKYVNIRGSAQNMRVITEPVDASDTNALMTALEDVYRQYPGMRVFAARGSIISSNNGGTRSINLDISGPRLESNYAVAQAVYRTAQDIFDNPRIQSNPGSLSLAQPMLEIHPDWDQSSRLGYTTESLGYAVAALTDGAYVDEFFMGDDKVDIYLYNQQAKDRSLAPEQLTAIPLYTPGGQVVPLGSIVTVEDSADTNSIRRVDGRRTVTLNIIPPADIALETGVSMVREQVIEPLRQSGAVPLDVQISLSGAADQLDATKEALSSNYAVALALIYLLLVAIFSHWGYPLLIMTTIPLGVAGGILGLLALNGVGSLMPLLGMAEIRQSFDMISMLGFLILMGTVVNNPILIVHRAIDNVKKEGMQPLAAVEEAVNVRLRPIAMSTITTLCGLAPLVLIPGAGTELYRGVGAIVMAGIVGAALVTLTTLPALTVMVLNRLYPEQSQSELSG